MSRTLVAGIGNIFMGDDGFGCEVAQRLSHCTVPAEVDVVDFGIRARDLSYALSEDYDLVILIDTVKRGGAPGTVYVLQPDLSDSDSQTGPGAPLLAAHDLDLATILPFLGSLGERCPRVLLVGCEPECLGGDYGYIGLSAAVSAAVEKAADEVQTLLKELPRSPVSRGTDRQPIVGPETGAAMSLQEVSR